MPPIIAQNAAALRDVYPVAEYRLWDGNALREMLAANFEPEVVSAFETLQPYSYKCDLARFCILYLYGGLYVDLGIRCLNQLQPPRNIGVASFRDYDFLSPCWTANSTSVIWARPGRSEFRIAIEYIVENCRNRYYGNNPLYPTGPVLWGRSLITAKAERKQNVDADDQWVGVCRPMTPGQKQGNICFITPDHSLVAIRAKGTGGDLLHLGAAGTNNYNRFWHARKVYGENESRWMFDDPAIRLTEKAVRTATGIAARSDAAGRLTYGPYIQLEPARYRLVVLFGRKPECLPSLLIDVSHDYGRVFHVHEVPKTSAVVSGTIEFEFIVSEPLSNVEFRLETFGYLSVEIFQFSLVRL